MPNWRSGLTFTKDPSDVFDYKFDFKALANGTGSSNWLDTSETISTRTVTVSTGLTKDSDTITDTNTSVTVWVSGGTAGAEYTIACKIVTSASRTIERTITIAIDQL